MKTPKRKKLTDAKRDRGPRRHKDADTGQSKSQGRRGDQCQATRLEWLTTKEACAVLGCSTQTLSHHIQNGHCDTKRVGRSVLVQIRKNDGIPCPACSRRWSNVLESHMVSKRMTIRRRRVCLHCRECFTTIERIETTEHRNVARTNKRANVDMVIRVGKRTYRAEASSAKVAIAQQSTPVKVKVSLSARMLEITDAK